MENIIQKIRKKGLVDFIFLFLYMLCAKVVSIVRIFFLRLRSYAIDYSVSLGSNFYIFQSVKKSIIIEKGTSIGDGVRIKAGFDGKIYVGKNVLIDDYTILDAHSKISIGDETMIASSVYVIDYNHKYPLSRSKIHILSASGYEAKPITIGKNVWIGTHAIILRGVTIGDNAVIGAGAVVTKNISANSVAVGNPAKIIRNL